MSTAQTLLSAEEFAVFPERDRRLTLVRGQIIASEFLGLSGGVSAARLGARLHAWADACGAGLVALRSGFILTRQPDTVLGPTVSFVRADRVPSSGVPDTFWEQAPDLAVEVVSPSETANEVREKVQDYLAAGTALAIVIYPKTRELVAHTPDDLARSYHTDDTFAAPDVLPGFAFPSW